MRRRYCVGEASKSNTIEATYTAITTNMTLRLLGSGFSHMDNIVKIKIDGIDYSPTDTHTFYSSGEHYVTFYFNQPITDTDKMFSQCTYLSYIDLSDFDTLEVASMEQMFYYDSRLTSLDFSFSDLKKVSNLDQAFQHCLKLTELKILSDMPNVSSTYYTFNGVETSGTFYYNKNYDYSRIISALPSTWTSEAVSS